MDYIAVGNTLKNHNADSPSELDAVCRTASRLFNVPSASATVIDETTVYIEGRSGAGPRSWPRSMTFCTLTVELGTNEALVVHDLAKDERFARNALVTSEPYLRFYAGVPVALSDGMNVGTLCVIDHVPRPDFGTKEIAELHDLARSVEAHLKLRQSRFNEEKREKELICAERLVAAKNVALARGQPKATKR